MSKIDDGGRASPGPGAFDEGMSLRDYFAAKALLGYLAGGYDFSPEALARIAYQHADAMIAERKEGKS